MAELEQELLSALQSLESSPEKPCGCHDKAISGASDAFSLESSATGDLAAQLDAALGQISSGEGFDLEFGDTFSLDEDLEFLEFAELEEGPQLDLSDIIAAAERYPGLKISFSF